MDPLEIRSTASVSPNLLRYVPQDPNKCDTSFSIKAPAGCENELDKKLLMQINHYVRAHPFITQSLHGYTTTQRRTFEREVYDYARTVGLLKEQARAEVRRARTFCGELDYDSDDSRLGDEVDDSANNPNTTLSGLMPAPKEAAVTETAIERISMTIPGDLVRAITGTRGVKIDTIRLLSGSLVEINDPEYDSNEQQITIIGLEKGNQVALNLLRAATQTAIGKKLKESQSKTISTLPSEAAVGTDMLTEATGVLSEPLESLRMSKKSKKRRANDNELVPALSTSVAQETDRRQKKTKRSRTEVLVPDLVSGSLQSGPDKPLSSLKTSNSAESRTKRSRKNEPKHTMDNHAHSLSNDEATATEEAQAKKKGRKTKAKKAEAEEMEGPRKTKTSSRLRAIDPTLLSDDVSPFINNENESVDVSALMTSPNIASGAAVKSERKRSTKHKKDRNPKKESLKNSGRDTRADETPAIDLQQTHAEASEFKTKKKKAKLPKPAEESPETPIEETRDKSTKSGKRMKSPVIAQEKHKAKEETNVGSIASIKSARKFKKGRQAEEASVVVQTEGGETEEEVRSPYFTPTKPKSKMLLSGLENDPVVKTPEALSSKAKSNLNREIEMKRKSFLTELRRRSSLGHIMAPLKDRVDTTVTVVASSASAPIIEEHDVPLKEETTKVKHKTQAVGAKKHNTKKAQPIVIEKVNNLDENARSDNLTVSPVLANVTMQDQGHPTADSKAKPLGKKFSNKKKMKKQDSTDADSTETILINEHVEFHSPGITMSKAASRINQDLAIPHSSPLHGGWNPVNQAILNAKKVAGFSENPAPCAAAKGEINGGHSYTDDPMELDRESWAIGGDLETCPNPSTRRASRKRKRTISVTEDSRDSSGNKLATKKSRRRKEEPGSSVDFSSPMIR
ncbi:hypothetical protein MMC11_005378 [Xylographa trunciseda]|nr:hypothetical protein [Xylographa trunciseda]